MFLLLGFLTFLALLFYWAIKDFNIFKNKGIPYDQPLPFIGNQWRLFLQSPSSIMFYERYYQMAKKTGIGGIFQMLKPGYVIADPELIKNITVKDFNHFMNHIDFSTNDLFSKNLFTLKDSKWKDVRATLSPAFTNTKMRIMFELIEKCALAFNKNLTEKSALTKDMKEIYSTTLWLSFDIDGLVKAEIKKLMARFTNDVIATTAFGIEVDSINDEKNEFFWMGKDLTDFVSGFRWLKAFIMFINPKLLNLIWKEGFFEENTVKYFRQIFLENIKARRDKGIIRPDMVHLMLEVTREEREKRNNEVLNDEDMLAQSLIFFIAGFDTVSSTLTFLLHHLAEHPDIQEKLYEEVKIYLEKTNGKVEFEQMKKLEYLEMVLNESQRMTPVITFLQRQCNKRYTIPANGDRPEVTIEPGEMILFFPYSFHHDPEYFPNPEKFDPERFSEENKSKINPYTFMPFGLGPRICIANRFAKMEIKLLLIHILKSFEVVFTEETKHPIKFSKKSINVTSDDGFFLGFKPRSQLISH